MAPEETTGRPSGRYVPLFWRLFVPNAALLLAAGVVLWVQPPNGKLIALLAGLATLVVINLVVMRRAFRPLARLTSAMREVDPLEPGRRLSPSGPECELTVLTETFNETLDRLETERRESGRRALAAQEGERRRVAAELHDEVGQSLLALAMQLDRLGEEAPVPLKEQLRGAHQVALTTGEEVRQLARRLRPEALDDLGLVSALAALCERLSEQTKLRIRCDVGTELPSLSPEDELVIYRVAQESLSNAIRHSSATEVGVSLEADGEVVRLEVRDDGVGLPGGAASGEGGIRGMRERAVSIGASLQLERSDRGGTLVLLAVPIRAGSPAHA